MKSIDFLYAALVATAIIHGGYLTILYRRYRRLQRELKEYSRGPGRLRPGR